MDGDVAEWRFAAGGQFEAASHGLVDLGWRRGPLSIELFTDTLDLRWRAPLPRGRVTVGIRGSAIASNLWNTPWTAGAPDDARAQAAQALGPDLRAEVWGPAGTWAAVEGFARYHWFSPLGDATLAVGDTPWARAALAVGAWSADGRSLRVAGGVDATATVVAPFVNGEGALWSDGRVAPFGQLYAGWATGADDVVATRVGGLTPYHVPLAGASWAEFWVEDYVVSRVGVEVRLDPVRLCAALDGGGWTYPDRTTLPDAPPRGGAVGGAVGASWRRRGWFAEGIAGWSPTLVRQAGVSRATVFVAVGTDWRGKNGPAATDDRPCAW